jgi:hypothetical protein
MQMEKGNYCEMDEDRGVTTYNFTRKQKYKGTCQFLSHCVWRKHKLTN